MKGQPQATTAHKKPLSERWWFRAIITALISSGIYFFFNMIKPTDPQTKAALLQVEQLKKSNEKDTLIRELTQRLTGQSDSQTVERVRSDVLAYLVKALNQYPTREEFAREKHRFIDIQKEVIWETKIENGNMIVYAVAPYTNKMDKVHSQTNSITH